jgi:hypothetical protein
MATTTPQIGFLPGFTRANGVVKRRMILSIEALEGAGKTRFTLTAPGPIAFLNFDYGLEGVVEAFQVRKPIYVASIKLDFDGSKDQVVDAATREMKKFEVNYQTALKQARTIVIDTGTELWELMRLAAFGKLTQVLPHMYASVNQEMTRLIKLAYDSDANLLITHRLKEQWVNDKRTGQFEFAGMKDVPFLVQAHVRLWQAEDGYHLKVGKSRQNATVAGLELVNEMIDFPTLAQFVFPESSREQWE